jgi:hypothetical protein
MFLKNGFAPSTIFIAPPCGPVGVKVITPESSSFAEAVSEALFHPKHVKQRASPSE